MHTRQSVAEPAQSEHTPTLPPLTPGELYPRELNQDGTTKHSRYCQSVFERRDWNCHRCLELLAGAAPRGGWQHEYFRRRRDALQKRFLW